ncbi:MAG: hypothetical protein AB7E48_03900, partial [Deferribacterales bacterium]
SVQILGTTSYLASLKEREELDAILPDLLSQMGLNVFSKPHRGQKESGVDVAAYGKIEDNENGVYLFSIKAGDITRTTWDGDTEQALRSSLNEIKDDYIPHRMPQKYRTEKVVICLCFGGDIQTNVRSSISGYISENTRDNISFEEWNGDKLAQLIAEHFLREELFAPNLRSLFRKSLSLIDEPEVSFENYKKLITNLYGSCRGSKERLKTLRQFNLCLWALFVWCREADNLESAYLSAELTLLMGWELSKSSFHEKKKVDKDIVNTYKAIFNAYCIISDGFINKVVMPHSQKLYYLSYGINSSNDVDVNLKLFDLLGRIAVNGAFFYYAYKQENDEQLLQLYQIHCAALVSLIKNNPLLYNPYKDEQAIDISLALWLLNQDSQWSDFIKEWLGHMLGRSIFNYRRHGKYPGNLTSYHDLIRHPFEKTKEYRKEVTGGSILYPMISMSATLNDFDEIYSEIKNFKETELPHCNFQLWYPDKDSEACYYTNSDMHGRVLCDVGVNLSKDKMLEQIFNECTATNDFEELSAIKNGFWPLLFVASRHYRIPLPVHFFKK